MASIDVTLELVTPAYAGGASTEQCDGLRPPVLKALLRFWWRAMHPELPPNQLFAREEQLFGSTNEGQRLRIIPLQNPAAMECQSPGQPLPGDTAFLSYGVSQWQQGGGFRTNRPRVATGDGMRFRLAWGGNLPTSAEGEFVKTLWLLSAFSGWDQGPARVGQRSRALPTLRQHSLRGPVRPAQCCQCRRVGEPPAHRLDGDPGRARWNKPTAGSPTGTAYGLLSRHAAAHWADVPE